MHLPSPVTHCSPPSAELVSLACTPREPFKNTPARSHMPKDSHVTGLRWGLSVGVFESSQVFLMYSQGPATLGPPDATGGLREGSPGVWASRSVLFKMFSPP